MANPYDVLGSMRERARLSALGREEYGSLQMPNGLDARSAALPPTTSALGVLEDEWAVAQQPRASGVFVGPLPSGAVPGQAPCTALQPSTDLRASVGRPVGTEAPTPASRRTTPGCLTSVTNGTSTLDAHRLSPLGREALSLGWCAGSTAAAGPQNAASKDPPLGYTDSQMSAIGQLQVGPFLRAAGGPGAMALLPRSPWEVAGQNGPSPGGGAGHADLAQQLGGAQLHQHQQLMAQHHQAPQQELKQPQQHQQLRYPQQQRQQVQHTQQQGDQVQQQHPSQQPQPHAASAWLPLSTGAKAGADCSSAQHPSRSSVVPKQASQVGQLPTPATAAGQSTANTYQQFLQHQQQEQSQQLAMRHAELASSGATDVRLRPGHDGAQILQQQQLLALHRMEQHRCAVGLQGGTVLQTNHGAEGYPPGAAAFGPGSQSQVMCSSPPQQQQLRAAQMQLAQQGPRQMTPGPQPQQMQPGATGRNDLGDQGLWQQQHELQQQQMQSGSQSTPTPAAHTLAQLQQKPVQQRLSQQQLLHMQQQLEQTPQRQPQQQLPTGITLHADWQLQQQLYHENPQAQQSLQTRRQQLQPDTNGVWQVGYAAKAQLQPAVMGAARGEPSKQLEPHQPSGQQWQQVQMGEQSAHPTGNQMAQVCPVAADWEAQALRNEQQQEHVLQQEPSFEQQVLQCQTQFQDLEQRMSAQRPALSQLQTHKEELPQQQARAQRLLELQAHQQLAAQPQQQHEQHYHQRQRQQQQQRQQQYQQQSLQQYQQQSLQHLQAQGQPLWQQRSQSQQQQLHQHLQGHLQRQQDDSWPNAAPGAQGARPAQAVAAVIPLQPPSEQTQPNGALSRASSAMPIFLEGLQSAACVAPPQVRQLSSNYMAPSAGGLQSLLPCAPASNSSGASVGEASSANSPAQQQQQYRQQQLCQQPNADNVYGWTLAPPPQQGQRIPQAMAPPQAAPQQQQQQQQLLQLQAPPHPGHQHAYVSHGSVEAHHGHQLWAAQHGNGVQIDLVVQPRSAEYPQPQLQQAQPQQRQLSGQDSCATPDGAGQEEVEAAARGGGSASTALTPSHGACGGDSAVAHHSDGEVLPLPQQQPQPYQALHPPPQGQLQQQRGQPRPPSRPDDLLLQPLLPLFKPRQEGGPHAPVPSGPPLQPQERPQPYPQQHPQPQLPMAFMAGGATALQGGYGTDAQSRMGYSAAPGPAPASVVGAYGSAVVAHASVNSQLGRPHQMLAMQPGPQPHAEAARAEPGPELGAPSPPTAFVKPSSLLQPGPRQDAAAPAAALAAGPSFVEEQRQWAKLQQEQEWKRLEAQAQQQQQRRQQPQVRSDGQGGRPCAPQDMLAPFQTDGGNLAGGGAAAASGGMRQLSLVQMSAELCGDGAGAAVAAAGHAAEAQVLSQQQAGPPPQQQQPSQLAWTMHRQQQAFNPGQEHMAPRPQLVQPAQQQLPQSLSPLQPQQSSLQPQAPTQASPHPQEQQLLPQEMGQHYHDQLLQLQQHQQQQHKLQQVQQQQQRQRLQQHHHHQQQQAPQPPPQRQPASFLAPVVAPVRRPDGSWGSATYLTPVPQGPSPTIGVGLSGAGPSQVLQSRSSVSLRRLSPGSPAGGAATAVAVAAAPPLLQGVGEAVLGPRGGSGGSSSGSAAAVALQPPLKRIRLLCDAGVAPLTMAPPRPAGEDSSAAVAAAIQAVDRLIAPVQGARRASAGCWAPPLVLSPAPGYESSSETGQDQARAAGGASEAAATAATGNAQRGWYWQQLQLQQQEYQHRLLLQQQLSQKQRRRSQSSGGARRSLGGAGAVTPVAVGGGAFPPPTPLQPPAPPVVAPAAAATDSFGPAASRGGPQLRGVSEHSLPVAPVPSSLPTAAAIVSAPPPPQRRLTPPPAQKAPPLQRPPPPDDEGCARSRPIDVSKLGQQRGKPPAVIHPVRPGSRLALAAAGLSGAARRLPATPGAAQVAAAPAGAGVFSEDAVEGAPAPYDGGGAAAPAGNRRRLAVKDRKVPVEWLPPVGKAVGAGAGGVRVKRGGGGAGRGGGAGGRDGKAAAMGKLLNKLREAKAVLSSRFVVRRSGIAQLGVFATERIPPDTLLMEYHGEAVRTTVADMREKRYKAAGLDVYLFNPGGPPDEAVVLDATYRGNIMRYVNHSCGPNCVSRTFVIEGQRRIFLFSAVELLPGTELTYDYKLSSTLCLDMFKGLGDEVIEQAAEQVGVELMLCQCGSKNCRKWL